MNFEDFAQAQQMLIDAAVHIGRTCARGGEEPNSLTAAANRAQKALDLFRELRGKQAKIGTLDVDDFREPVCKILAPNLLPGKYSVYLHYDTKEPAVGRAYADAAYSALDRITQVCTRHGCPDGAVLSDWLEHMLAPTRDGVRYDLWKEIVTDAGVDVNLCPHNNEPPRDFLRRVIRAHEQIVLDPAVSKRATQLINQGAEAMRKTVDEANARRLELAEERDRLRAIINTPLTDDFIRAVSQEAEHQRARWGSSHDEGKTAADWFWLIGYLAGKALQSLIFGDTSKGLHHIITTAAACANWHRAVQGKTDMRPGIEGTAEACPNCRCVVQPIEGGEEK